MKYLTNLNLEKNELQNARIQNLASPPGNPVEGQIYYNTALKRMFQWNGTEWIGMDSIGASMTGDNIVAAINSSSTTIDGDHLNVGGAITGATVKTTPSDTDVIGFVDSVLKKVTWLNIKTTLKTYFDGLYNMYTHPANHPPSIITQDSSNRFVTDAEKSTWSGKQDALGFTPLNANLKGANNGVAELDAGGKVPSSQLPSYVDDVLEYANLAGFPASGETGKIYVAQDTNVIYRWSGSAYVEISSSLALGETSATAYRGDRGKMAYDHSQVAHAPATADQTTGTNVGSSIHGSAAKATLVDADTLPLIDSAASNVLKKITFANLKTTLTTYFNTLYNMYSHPSDGGGSRTGLTGASVISGVTVNIAGHVTATTIRDITALDVGAARKYTVAVGGSTSVVITHNLNTRDLAVTIRETGSPYAQVMTDIEFTTVNSVTVKFAVAPAAGAYTITLVG